MPDLSLVIPYYRNPGMLRRQIECWRDEWPADLKARVEIVIVDDGTPDETAAEVLAEDIRFDLPALSLYRVLIDKPWNQHAARNIGAHVAKARWLLMTDMDHVVPGSTLGEVLRLLPDLGKRDVLTFGRVDAPADGPWRSPDWCTFKRTTRDDGSLKPHVNSFVVARKYYWALGAYDERLCGLYGTDMDFRRRLYGPRSKVTHLDHAPLIRVGREVIADASTRDFERKTTDRNAAKKAAQAARSEAGGANLTLQSPYERVAL